MTENNHTEQPEPQSIVETEHGKFEIVKDYKDAFDVTSFNEKYVSHFDQYIFIVGDISADMLRLKGFSKKDKDRIFDYLMESATPNAPYFILRRLDEQS